MTEVDFIWIQVCDKLDMIVPQFDACASWWTQGPDATFQVSYMKLIHLKFTSLTLSQSSWEPNEFFYLDFVRFPWCVHT